MHHPSIGTPNPKDSKVEIRALNWRVLAHLVMATSPFLVDEPNYGRENLVLEGLLA